MACRSASHWARLASDSARRSASSRRPAGRVGLLGQGRLLDLQPGHPPGELVQLGRHGVDLGAQPRPGLVDQVDGLVGEEPVADVAVAEGGRGDQGAVLDLDAVEHLQPLAQPAQDRDGVLDAGLVDQDGLEAALQGGVLLDPLAVLVDGGGPDHVQLAAGQHRLEHVAGVHGAFGGAGPDHGVELVDEQENPPLGGADLVEHRLEPLLELAPVLGPGDQGAQVEGEDRLVAQPLGHVAADDPLGQALHDGGLADPRVADQHRVVLGLARQDLHHPPDLGVAADHRVEPAGAGVGDQVAPVLGQGLVGDLGHGRGDPLVAAHPGQRGQEALAGDALLAQQPPGGAGRALVQEGEQQVLDRDVLVLEPAGFPLGGVEQAGQPLGDHHLPGRDPGPGHSGPSAQLALDRAPQQVGVGPGRRQQPRHQALGLVEQGQQQVLAVDLGVAEAQRLGLGVVQGLLRLLGQTVEVHSRSSLLGCEAGPPGRARSARSRTSMRSRRSSTRPMAA
jgi:hypothetical protein